MVRVKKISALAQESTQDKKDNLPSFPFSEENQTHLAGSDSKHQGYLTE